MSDTLDSFILRLFGTNENVTSGKRYVTWRHRREVSAGGFAPSICWESDTHHEWN